MKNLLRKKSIYFKMVIDSSLILGAYGLAYLLRFEGQIPSAYAGIFQTTSLYLVPLKLLIFWNFGLYRGVWRYTSLVDFSQVLKATLFALCGEIVAVLILHPVRGFPRSLFILDWILTFIFITGVRVATRFILTETEKGKPPGNLPWPKKMLLIIGAGDAGEKILREIRDNPRLKYEVVGFLDDDPGKKGMSIHGVPVLGEVSRIMDLAARKAMDEILIAMPSASSKQMRRIVEACEATGLKYRTTPAMGEIIDGSLSFRAIREVSFEDLLNRQEVHLDQEGIARYLRQKRVLVTGAGGSVGSELIRHICCYHPQAVALLEMNELNLYRMEMECRQRFAYVPTANFLVDIRRREALERAFRVFRPQVVFHAAAYKHVPLQELYPWEAVYNNVIGTRNLVEISQERGAERFVLVSTDKAVRPVNVMGATKRVAELLVEGRNGDSPTRFMAVRFGNVARSSGSVIPLFEEQIARGGPVTVTHPEMVRYFMSIQEAAQLILQAGAMGEGGEIFILDMGQPVRILDLAKDLIRLYGLEPEQDIPIRFIGLRPGEKLYEELITEGEGIVNTTHEKILVLRGKTCDVNSLNAEINELLAVTRTYRASSIRRKLQEMVPDYTPQNSGDPASDFLGQLPAGTAPSLPPFPPA